MAKESLRKKPERSLEGTADGINPRYKDLSISPAKVPFSVFQRLKILREQGLLSRSEFVIVNDHQEMGINIFPPLEREELLGLIYSLKDSHQETLDFGPRMTTLDLYPAGLNDITQRFRLYFLDGTDPCSVRTITAIGDSPLIQWPLGNLSSACAREECFFVDRTDGNRGNYLLALRHFLNRHQQIDNLISKEVVKGTLKGTMWDHRRAVSENDEGHQIDLTEEENILGMSPYLALSAQRVQKTPDLSLTSFEAQPFLEKLIGKQISSKICYQKLGKGALSKSSTRIEIEYRGEGYQREAFFLTTQLVEALTRKQIPFSFAESRKITCS